PRAIGRPSSSTSSGPRIRNSIRAFYRFPSHFVKHCPGGWRPLINPVVAALLPRPATLSAMARPLEQPAVSYHGEVWTYSRGQARTRLPAEADPLRPPLEYELRDLEPQSSARVTAELKEGRFTIATEQPHIKVAWRITGHPRHRQQEEE